MTTTPTIWKAAFFPNFETPAGNQSRPQTIGLANGNILTVWEDDTGGPNAGRDIMGRIISPEGHVTGAAAFQINTAWVNGDETEPKIVALPDGGFVVAYGGYADGAGGFIVVERFNSSGGQITSRFITDERSSLTGWEITADSAGNYTVVFEREIEAIVSGDTVFSVDVHAITYDAATNNAGPERVGTAQNEHEDDDQLAAVASFANGHIITLTTEPDHAFDGGAVGTVEFTITDPVTGNRTRMPTQIAGSPGVSSHDDATALDVAVLTGGQFVMLFKQRSFDASDDPNHTSYGFYMRIGAGEAPGSAIAPAISILPSSPNGTVGNAQIVALPDGGFFVAWGPAGQRFAADGSTIGGTVSLGIYVLGRLSLTADGRILVSGISNGEIAEVILDPRENLIQGTAAGEVLTTQVGSTTIFGHGGDDTIYGQGGNDFIYGGAGDDDLRGGGGADTLFGEAGTDVLGGGAGNDTCVLQDLHLNQFKWVHDTVIEAAGGGIDTVNVGYIATTNVTGYTLGANVENGVVIGTGAFNLTGNSLDNVLTGNNGINTLSGNAGNDTINGLGGADTLIGGDGNDKYIVDNAGDSVTEGANGGSDRVLTSVSYALGAAAQVEILSTSTTVGAGAINLTGNAYTQNIIGNAGANTLNGLGGADLMQGLGGNDRYHVDNSADVIVEAVGGGTADRVLTSVDYTLKSGVDVELLTTTSVAGTTALKLTGNSIANIVLGNAGDNLLNGAAGADTLTGLGGDDVFTFNTALGGGNIDDVTDFSVANDTIHLENAIFANIVGTGTLTAAQFVANASGMAQDTSDRIIYETDTGRLIYDANGSTAGGRYLFATLDAGLAITNADFFIV